MGSKVRRKGQLALRLKKRFGHGGKRKGAGRKRLAPAPRVKHRARAVLGSNQPVHVTWRVLPHVWNLRSRRAFRTLLRAFRPAVERFGTRLTHFSVQGNHLHLIVEADGAPALSSAMQGLAIRIAKGLNRMMDRIGKVFADRFHARPLRTPTDAHNAIAYVLGNARVHAERQGRAPSTAPDRFAASPADLRATTPWWRTIDGGAPPITLPTSWLLGRGWMRAAS